MWWRQLPTDLRSIRLVESIVEISEPLQGVAFLENEIVCTGAPNELAALFIPPVFLSEGSNSFTTPSSPAI
jgi:hypothetical protein